MEVTFLLKKFITQLIIPPFNLLLLIVFALLIAKRWPRTSRALIWTSSLTLILLATPAVANFLLRAAGTAQPFDAAAANSAGAIVILGGGLRSNTPEYGDTPSRLTLDRIRYGATIARQTHLPILVTGGAVTSQTAEAQSMAQTLQQEFSAPVRWVEDRALDTEDNMNFSAAMLRSENITTVVLVTHDYHMTRAMIHCGRSGLKCIPAPVSYSGSRNKSPWFFGLPSAGSLETSAIAIHEKFGRLALLIR